MMSNQHKDKKPKETNKDDGSMKTPEHTMADNQKINREEFISDQPSDFDDRNLDDEGLNSEKLNK